MTMFFSSSVNIQQWASPFTA